MLLRIAVIIPLILFTACSGENSFEGMASTAGMDTGDLILTSVATDPQTGPGIASIFSGSGIYKRTLKDFYGHGAEFASGAAYVPPNKILLSVDGVDRIESINLDTGLSSVFVAHPGLSATPLKQMVKLPDGGVVIGEYNSDTVEKFDRNGVRVGAPFIPATVGSCTISNAFSIAVITPSENIAVLSYGTSGRISIYTKTGECVSQFTTSPVNASTPSGVAYHALSNKLIVTRAADHTIWSVNLDGSNPTQIFLQTSVISTPRAVATDSAGYIYIGSNGTDTVEKLYYNGTGVATRVQATPLIGPGIFTQNLASITVIE